jgi:hypothetical protein
MGWLHLLAQSLPVLMPLAGSVTPVGAATGSLVDYLLGFGPLGIGCLALSWVLYRGLLLPKSAVGEAVTAGRADLLRELDRTLADKLRAEEQRDAALKIAQEQLVPMLVSFTATAQSLIPLLQALVAGGESIRVRRTGGD